MPTLLSNAFPLSSLLAFQAKDKGRGGKKAYGRGGEGGRK